MPIDHNNSPRTAHTLMELVVAMVASAMLLAGLGSVMLIASQVAYTPSAAVRRTATGDVVSHIAEELRYATLIIKQTPQILEFVVADRNGDGTAEKIRYEWSGTPGDPLYRTYNSAAAVAVLNSVNAFSVSLLLTQESSTFESTVDSAETLLLSNISVQGGDDKKIEPTYHVAQVIDPATLAGQPANALYWNATRVRFYGENAGGGSDLLYVELRPAGNSYNGPTSDVLGRVIKPKSSLSSNSDWNEAAFAEPVRELSLNRPYAVVWRNGTSTEAFKLRLTFNIPSPIGVFESTDSPLAGATWHYAQSGSNYAQIFGQLYGTYTTSGPSYNHTRNLVSHVRLTLQSGEQAHARIDSSIPLANSPELLSAYWRADFDADPTATNANGDSVADWALAGGTSFDDSSLVGGTWYVDGALETRPLADFALPTTVECRCRNTTVGGNGAVVRINADRQGGLYAPLLVYVQQQTDGSQTLSLVGKTSDAASMTLCTRSRLAGDFVRFRLTILPQDDVVNLQINGEDQGTFSYPTYAPSSANDRFVTLYADSSLAEFDYVDVRVGTN